MPYRRLPNTDQARLRALKAAVEQGDYQDMYTLAFSQKTLIGTKSFLPLFEKHLLEYQMAYNAQVKNGKTYQELQKKARLYVSHFIQTINMAIARGEIKPNVREFFALPQEEKAIPDLSTDKSLLEWGEKTIQGETKRISHGGSPIYTPSIANVRVWFDKFKEAYNFQNILQNNTQRAHNHLIKLREEADSLILNIWNQVEQYNKDLDQENFIKKCKDYGLIYYFRKNEKEEENVQLSA